jgi:DNA-binding transcriptional LysR family regulator
MTRLERPEMRELECFLAVAEHLNFSRAARSLGLSQPPLTRHIQALEGRVGCRLLKRDTHSVSLTEPGRRYLEDARAALAILDRASESLRLAREGVTERLRLAFVGALLDEPLVRLFQKFQESHPRCHLEVTDLAPAAQVEAILSGELDGGFMGARPEKVPRELDLTVWREEELLLAVPAGHPLAAGAAAGGRTGLAWKALRGQSWVMVSREAAPAFRQQFAGLCAQTGLGTVKIVQESERVTAILAMVAVGSGITLVPEGAGRIITHGVTFLKLARPVPRLQHAFACRRSGSPPSTIKEFLRLLVAASDPRPPRSRR